MPSPKGVKIEMPIGLVKFENLGVPKTLSQRAINRAVTSAIFGPPKSAADLEAKALRIVLRWRETVNALARLGWAPTDVRSVRKGSAKADAKGVEHVDSKVVDSQLWRLLNCRPSTFAHDRTTRACERTAVCPHCRGRLAAHLYRELAAFCFPPHDPTIDGPVDVPVAIDLDDDEEDDPPAPPRSGRYDLVRRTLSVPTQFGADDRGRSRLAVVLRFLSERKGSKEYAFPSRRGELRRLEAAGCVGGFECTSVGLRFEAGADEPVGWDVRVKQLCVVTAGRGAAFASDPRVVYEVRRPGASLKTSGVVERPCRRELADAVGWLARYPNGLLSHPQRIVEFMDARSDGRLFTRFGRLHGRSGGH